ncbi:acid phosphatase [Intrasporangium chromatireducens Q5-1]|uniref:phospholipase C n=1 Tax=Intrasporangium chromatireducens Q5-1 TaxID=584657 RepID=W9GIM7_9MICO|nr:alkaline phosphatase family protein [Intrasporangium chromatireducens]EWT04668.1 acid phosphatase [Intrasporangium chromatireducens Q5-1]
MRASRWRALAVAPAAALAGLLLAACTSGGPAAVAPSPDGSAASAAPESSLGSAPGGSPGRPPAHVVVVVFENKAQQQVLGSPDAPYLNALSATGARFSRSRAVTHPSQPNYLALFSGSTQGVTDDSCPQRLGERPNLAQQLVRAGHSFAGYSEGLPSAGFTGCSDASGRYARKHNPWVDFANVSASANLPLTALPTDLSRLPTVSFVIPDLCHDMHDCDVATGDRWARDHLAPYVAWARSHDSLLVVTFDEDDGSPSNRILTFLVGPMVKAAVIPQPADHYSLLRTIEDLYGLEPLGAARSASPLAGWRAG